VSAQDEKAKSGGTPTRARTVYWDNLKGFLILLVVFGHFVYEYKACEAFDWAFRFIYMFHMPAFIFVSGYFSKSENSLSARGVGRLFVLFFFLNFSMMIYAYHFDERDLSILFLYYSSWYLLALFVYRLTWRFVRDLALIFPISLLLSICVGFVPRDLDIVWEWEKIVALYPFFVAGALISEPSVMRFRRALLDRRGAAPTLFVVSCALVAGLAHSGVVAADDLLWRSYGAASHAEVLQALGVRVLVLAVAALMIAALVAVTPEAPLRPVNTWGRNSLVVYVGHRIFTLLLVLAFPALAADAVTGWLWIALATLAVMAVLGSDTVARPVNRLLDGAVAAVLPPTGADSGGRALRALFVSGGFGIALGLVATHSDLPWGARVADRMSQGASEGGTADIDRVLSETQARAIDEAVSVSFVGDLILLRDQVLAAYDAETDSHDFDPVFRHAKPYLTGADLSLGVFEGPMAGAAVGYSTSSYDDHIPIYLNFPDSFAQSVKDAGIDFVTTATNHVMDFGVEGALRTLDVLDRIGLGYTGSYRDAREKEDREIAVVTVNGLRIAVLSYTYGSNYYEDAFFFEPENRHITSVIVSPDSPYFAAARQAVLDDFAKARALNPDTIVVLPHMGTQFKLTPDRFQRTWMDLFIKAGADIVFGDHPHAVQPLEWRPSHRPGREAALVLYCPGNFVNSYTEDNGDAMAIVEAYLDPASGAPVAAGIVPMWAHAPAGGLFSAVPIHDIARNADLRSGLSDHDMARVREVQTLVTNTMLGRSLSFDQSQRMHYLLPDGHAYRRLSDPLDTAGEERRSTLYAWMSEARSITFVGDSVTEGARNGGYGWYEPLAALFPDARIEKRAWDSHTIGMLLARADEIVETEADLFVIAAGINDIRYRDPAICAMTADAFVTSVDALVERIRAAAPRARFVLIAPWTTDHYDPVTPLEPAEVRTLRERYSTALDAYAEANGMLFIDPNPALDTVFRTEDPARYLIDHIHPNAGAGIRLYSTAVLRASDPARRYD
jgi:fucose 4-O-acetylase-like acetyltransferase/poly-gamma-glutamate capsule biosynthesis protein CapA/YwtB (metallophosphatase superfamily)/lysophospholipase L1-like esterase